MNKFRFARKLVSGRLTGKRIPFQLNIHVTDACNLRCKYCYINFSHAAPDMPFAQLELIIRDAADMGTERISLEGGEPLIRKDIGDIVNLVRDLDMECNINTNGFFVAAKIEQIKRVDMLSVSLDGPKEVHDAMRGAGSFDKAIQAIGIARQRGIKVHVLFVMNRSNRYSLDALLDLAQTHGFTLIPTSLFFQAGAKIDERRSTEFVLEDDDYRQWLAEIYDRKKAGAPIVWSLGTLRYVTNWPVTFRESNLFDIKNIGSGRKTAFKPVKCRAANAFCVMDTNGDLYPCDPLLGYGKAPSAVELGFKEAFNRLSTGGCLACNSIVCTEMNQLFSGNLATIGNLVRNYGKRH